MGGVIGVEGVINDPGVGRFEVALTAFTLLPFGGHMLIDNCPSRDPLKLLG